MKIIITKIGEHYMIESPKSRYFEKVNVFENGVESKSKTPAEPNEVAEATRVVKTVLGMGQRIVGNSYELKHRCEKFTNPPYISNGAFIIAALECGLKGTWDGVGPNLDIYTPNDMDLTQY